MRTHTMRKTLLGTTLPGWKPFEVADCGETVPSVNIVTHSPTCDGCLLPIRKLSDMRVPSADYSGDRP